MTEFPNWFAVTAESNFNELLPTNIPLRVLQIGVFTGDATAWLYENRDIEYMHDVDTWEGSKEQAHDVIDFNEVYEHYLSRVKKLPNLKHWRTTSNKFFEQVTEEKKPSYNFIYIDGDHTASQTLIDGLNAYSLLEVGGLLAFDDYAWQAIDGQFYSPKLGIEGFAYVTQGRVEVITATSQVWFRKLI